MRAPTSRSTSACSPTTSRNGSPRTGCSPPGPPRSTRHAWPWAGRCTAPTCGSGMQRRPSGPTREPGGKDLPRVDGHLSAEPGLALLVLAADCFPVALSDGSRVAMLHCGWRRARRRPRGAGDRATRRAGGRGRRPGHRRLLLRGGARGARGLRRPRGGGRRADAGPARGDRPQARGGRRGRRAAPRPLHELQSRPLFLPPPRQRRDRPPGRPGGRWMDADSGPGEPGAGAGADRPRGGDLRRDQVRGGGGPARPGRGRDRAGGREPRAGAAEKAGGAPRPVRLGLHRRPAEPQGARHLPQRAPDPLGGL